MPPDKPSPSPRVPSPYQSFQELRSTMMDFRKTVLETLKGMKKRQETAIAVSNAKLGDLEQRLKVQARWLIVVWAIVLFDLAFQVWRR